MSTAKRTVLLTGFGPFPGVPINVSAVFADRLATRARETIPTATFVSAALPTIWRQAPVRLEELYFTHRPDIALHFGVSHLAHAMTVECFARNCAERPDAIGDGPAALGILTPDGPSERSATVPTGRLISRLHRQNIPAVLSHDAGNYLCNAILYHSLELMLALEIEGQCGFVHLPIELPHAKRTRSPMAGRAATNRQLSFEDALKGGLEILATLLQRPPQTRPILHQQQTTA